MQFFVLAVISLLGVAPAVDERPQRRQEREEEFMQAKPVVGDALPEVSVHRSDGRVLNTSDLIGHFTVLTFGCLT
jgi:hypothetical protein